MSARLAVYFAPPAGCLLDQLAGRWLGRDAWMNERAAQPAIEGIEEFTAEPRRYGFHATLKAPFHPGKERGLLSSAVDLLSRRHPPVVIDKAVIGEIDGFLALVPEFESEDVQSLAASCVTELDRYRAPLTQAELERRRRAGLSPRQERLTRNWGYPFVLDEFRFHMTLTRKLDPRERDRIGAAAKDHFAAVIGRPLVIDALTIFREPTEGAPFIAEERFPLRGTTISAWPEAWKFGVR